MIVKISKSEDDTKKIGKFIAKKLLKKYKIVCFDGEVGAGKTVVIKAILKALGVKDVVASPTFTLVKTYKTKIGVVHHFDLYRIENKSELKAFGIEEYFLQGHSLIEWPKIAQSFLPKTFVKVKIEKVDETTRQFVINEVK